MPMGATPKAKPTADGHTSHAVKLSFRHRLFTPSDTPLVMGILNTTPDSFSDGGDLVESGAACARALKLIAAGADVIDVGPESTRPGAVPVSTDDQIARAVPVIKAIRAADAEIPISIDTRLAPVAEAALAAGADMVNDVSALRDDPAMVGVVASAGVPVVLMHRKGTSVDMQRGGGPRYDDVVGEIAGFLRERRSFAVGKGVDPARIIFDPGIGFGKRIEHNLLILQRLGQLVGLGQPVLVGASRKAFIGHVLDIAEPKRRVCGSVACVVLAAMAGAAIVRVHDVEASVEAIRMCRAVKDAESVCSPELPM